MIKDKLLAAAVEQFKKKRTISDDVVNFFVQVLQYHAGRYMDKMAPRVKLSDGRMGYRAEAESKVNFVLGADPYDKNAPRETIHMVTKDSEVCPLEPVVTLDGEVRVDIEVCSFTMEGVSEKLFGKKTPIRMSAGVGADKFARPSFGHFAVPMSQLFGQTPVRSAQNLFVTVETPIGTLFNRDAAKLVAHVQAIPPLGVPYTQEGIVQLMDESGKVAAVKDKQTTMLTRLIV